MKKLKNFAQSEALSIPYYHEDDVLTYTELELGNTEDDDEVIQFLLENDFAEFDENPIIESDGIDSGAM